MGYEMLNELIKAGNKKILDSLFLVKFVELKLIGDSHE